MAKPKLKFECFRVPKEKMPIHPSSNDNSPVASIKCGRSRSAACALGSEKLRGKVALITRGDSGIGRAVAIFFAKEGVDEDVSYFKEDKDARGIGRLVGGPRPEMSSRVSVLYRAQRRWISFCHQVVRPAFSFRKVLIICHAL